MRRWWAPILGVLMAVSGMLLLVGTGLSFEELVQVVVLFPVFLFFAVIAGIGDQAMTLGGQAIFGAGLMFAGLAVMLTWLLSLVIRRGGEAFRKKS